MSDNVLKWSDYARHWSKQTGVPTPLILAIIEVESSGRPEVSRAEPEYLNKLRKTKHGMNKLNRMKALNNISNEEATTSYGLMQPLLMLAWGYGAKNKEELLDPYKNIRYCTAHLATLAKKTSGKYTDEDVKKIAGFYNGAGARSTYASKVLKAYKKYGLHLQAS